jgi:hypothetical protein
MRKSLLPGLMLVLAAVLVMWVSSVMDLELESVALLGAALGGVLALVPDRSPAVRVGGFAIGFVVAWVGYLVRAALLPDSVGGRAVAVGLVVLVCVLVAAATADRIPLWTLLLGTAAMAGAFEFSYAAAPPEALGNSVTAATTVLFNVALGFLAAAAFGPVSDAVPSARRRPTPVRDDSDSAPLDDLMMEKNH